MPQHRLNRAFLMLTLAFGIFLAGSYALIYMLEPKSDSHKNANRISLEAPPGGDFTLLSPKGEVSLSDFKGKLVLAYFGYTFCPDICPTNLGNLSVAYRQLTQQQKDNLEILFISVDPERDTPQRLQQYADYFDSNIIGLTSSPEVIAEVARRYGAVYERVDDGSENYAVDHSAFTYVIDQNGILREQLPHALGSEQFLDAINRYLN
ncbi:SCO family protein [Thiomicrospira microaerophila]|uniref:SCO family protein n=1 Tax=Thiomicrospira microaerophila TaxID=406020 RepID=UPI00201063D7|nr:SCO family protein [Thiomicrospira microaerophila]UQB42624.1 SCO family protein [Thiomicrospira microaerophila]